MADITLTFSTTPYDRLLPLITGEVKPDGISLDYMPSPGGVPVDAFPGLRRHFSSRRSRRLRSWSFARAGSIRRPTRSATTGPRRSPRSGSPTTCPRTPS